MKKFLIGFAILTLICGAHIYFLFKNGYRAPPNKVMTPTSFNKPEEIGAVLARRYWNELRSERVVVLGLSPFVQTGREIWGGFLRTTLALNIHFDRYFILHSLPSLGVEAKAAKFEPFDLKTVDMALKGGQRVFIYHLSTDAESTELAKHFGQGLLLFQAQLAVSPAGEAALQTPCCDAITVSRRYYRKNLSAEKLIAVLEKQGSLKQILYVHEPELPIAVESK